MIKIEIVTVGTLVTNSLPTTPAEEGCRCRFCTNHRSANPEAQNDQPPATREEWYPRSISPEIYADEATDQEDLR
ncbi:hypothetical protein JTB14_001219 [Gonioctena quinquepunctata]|nr:hypothetical protein JTB14_001219 [Gonioctena quinquepunctata]